MKVSELARIVGGKVVGDPETEVDGVSSPQNPKEGTVVFCQSEKDVRSAVRGRPSVLVVSEDVDYPSYILVEDVKLALALFLEKAYPEVHPTGISERACIGLNVEIGKNVYIGPFAFVGNNVIVRDNVKIYPFTFVGDNTFIGEGTVLFPGVVIYPNTVIGRNVRIHSGAVIGADGFGYHIGERGIRKLNHIGNVVIEDNVEIGANTTIDRALIDSTRVRRDTKVDNLVMIAHNCDIGERNVLVSQVGISGSVKTGRDVILAGQVGVADHITIGDRVTVTAKSGVTKDLKPGKVYGATIPAVEWTKWKRIYALILKLPDLFKRLR
ncbi:MAG: UDP-3-O-(3-hydroxymyristoyl)glucosamine N-acyltransferase [Aquificota bacterium]|nr:UDP-3-O-(3-hydroxymyristoyl)glucosamine N-acyltransferase [Aquificota bacterium]